MIANVYPLYVTGSEYIEGYELRLRNAESKLAKARKLLDGFQEIRGVGHPKDVDQVRFVQKLESEVYWQRKYLNAVRKLLC